MTAQVLIRRKNERLDSRKSQKEACIYTPESQSPFPRDHDLPPLTLSLYLFK